VVLSGGVADGTCATVWSTTRRAHASRRIEHRLRQVQGAWLVYDLLLEGDSLVEQQRQRLERSIQESSWDEALWHLRLHDLQAVASDEITRPRRR
jgi:ABC-type transporter MlaC component